MKKEYYSVGLSPDDPVWMARMKLRRSEFICRIARTDSMAGARDFISRISRENKTATHNCWAYIVGDQGETRHSSDAGEPAGSAGRPMLGVLEKYNMTVTTAVVTRHYGGVKLGIPGLIRAYADVVAATLESGTRVRLVQTTGVQVCIGYGANDQFLNQARQMGARADHSEYGDQVTHAMVVATEQAPAFFSLLDHLARQGTLHWQENSG